MNLFGRCRQNSAAPAPPLGPRERIAHQLEMLTKREEHLRRKMDNEIRMAREFSAQGKKREALMCFQRKKMYEKQCEQIIGAPLCTYTPTYPRVPGSWLCRVWGALRCEAQPALASGPALLTCPRDPGPHHLLNPESAPIPIWPPDWQTRR